jgi:hypothetical protein
MTGRTAERVTVVKPTEAESRERRRYEVEDAVRTLTRAEQIKSDAKLMADVRTLAADLKRVAGREKREPDRKEAPRREAPKKTERAEGKRLH